MCGTKNNIVVCNVYVCRMVPKHPYCVYRYESINQSINQSMISVLEPLLVFTALEIFTSKLAYGLKRKTHDLNNTLTSLSGYLYLAL